MANESIWNGSTLTITGTAGSSDAAISGTYQSYGPFQWNAATVDVTPVSQTSGYKLKLSSGVMDAGEFSGVLYFNAYEAIPEASQSRRVITWTVEPSGTNTSAVLEGTGFLTSFELQEGSADASKMASISFTWEGGTSTNASPSTSAAAAPTWTARDETP